MERAKEYLVKTLHEEDDWIVLNMTMKTLQRFVKDDPSLIPKIAERARLLAKDRRNSVSKGAFKLLNAAGEPVDLLK
jgi:hypothetical protein